MHKIFKQFYCKLPKLVSNSPKNYWKDTKNHEKYISQLAAALGVEKPEDWYKLKISDIVETGGLGLVTSYYGGSIQKMISSQHELPHTWKFENLPREFWNDKQNVVNFLNWFSSELGIEQPEHWYKVKSNDFSNLGGYNLSLKYQHSHFILVSTFLNLSLQPWKFNRVPKHFWNDKKNERWYCDDLATLLGITEFSDWYRSFANDFQGTSVLFTKYDGSHFDFLNNIYCEINWKPWYFSQTPNQLLQNLDVQKQYLLQIEDDFGIESKEDWYKVRGEDFRHYTKQIGIIKLYKYSVYNLVKTHFPEYNWIPWKFVQLSTNFWNDKNVDNFLQYFHKEFDINTEKDWKYTTTKNIRKFGKNGILNYLGGFENLKNYGIKILKKKQEEEKNKLSNKNTDNYITNGIYSTTSNDNSTYIINDDNYTNNYNQNTFGNTNQTDNSKTPNSNFNDNNHTSIYNDNNSNTSYQDIDSNTYNNDINKISKSQMNLFKILKKLFKKNEKIYLNYLHPNLIFEKSLKKIELDLYLPNFKIAFEFEKEKYFKNFKNKNYNTEKNSEKFTSCKKLDIILIEIPISKILDKKTTKNLIISKKPELNNYFVS